MDTLIGQEVTVERLFPDGTKDCIVGEVTEFEGMLIYIEKPRTEDLTPDHVLARNGGKYHHGLLKGVPGVWVNLTSPVILSVVEN